MKTSTVLCGVTLLACAAAANLDRLDDRADATVAAVVTANAETEALLANVDRLAAGTMTPAERLAWQRDLAARARAAHASMRQAQDTYSEHKDSIAY